MAYLNTDLDLVSADDLTPLAAALEAAGLLRLHVGKQDDGLWHARFEPSEQHESPEESIAALLPPIESLIGPLSDAWAGCLERELSIGYQSGHAPRPLEHAISSPLLGRAAALGVSLGIVLYSP
jgi:hypothetical protein